MAILPPCGPPRQQCYAITSDIVPILGTPKTAGLWSHFTYMWALQAVRVM